MSSSYRSPQLGDGVVFATGGYDNSIRLWHPQTGTCHRNFQHADSAVNAIDISNDRQYLCAVGYQRIRLYDLRTNKEVVCFEGVQKNITTVKFLEDSQWMVTAGEDCKARVWDIRTKNIQCMKIFEMDSPANCVAIHPNQCDLFICDQSGAIHMWNLSTAANEQLIPDPDSPIQSISVNSEGSYLAAVNDKGKCYIWSLTGGSGTDAIKMNPRKELEVHSKYALKCLFSPDSTYLATCSADGSTKIWQTVDFELVSELKANPPKWMWDCAFSADSRYVFTASSDNIARLWNASTGECIREFHGHQRSIVALAFKDTPSSYPF